MSLLGHGPLISQQHLDRYLVQASGAPDFRRSPIGTPLPCHGPVKRPAPHNPHLTRTATDHAPPRKNAEILHACRKLTEQRSCKGSPCSRRQSMCRSLPTLHRSREAPSRLPQTTPRSRDTGSRTTTPVSRQTLRSRPSRRPPMSHAMPVPSAAASLPEPAPPPDAATSQPIRHCPGTIDRQGPSHNTPSLLNEKLNFKT